jgi:hypothetical protein
VRLRGDGNGRPRDRPDRSGFLDSTEPEAMMNLRVLMLCIVLVPQGACEMVYHVETALPPDRVITDARLPGVWGDPHEQDPRQEESEIRIEAGPGTDYTVTAALYGERPQTLFARLGVIGSHTVVEVWPDASVVDEEWIPGTRLLFVIELGDQEMSLRHLDGSRLAALLEEPGSELAIEREGSDLVVSGTTAQLFRLYSVFLARPDAFRDSGSPWRLARRGGGVRSH